MCPPPQPDPLARYARQVCYRSLGPEGQRRLLESRALVCGCGALGSLLATWLVRAGVGTVRIVDPDVVEETNLQRQILFKEQHASERTPKAMAAAEVLRQCNGQVVIEPVVARATRDNIRELGQGTDCIVDGTDNFPARFLLNDYCVEQSVPWVYGGCVGAEGQTMTIVPGQTACLRCLMRECPPPGTTPTVETAGVLGPIVGTIASVQAAEALKILSGNRHAVSRSLTVVELWDAEIRQVDLSSLREQTDCPACKRREFPWLSGEAGTS